MKKSLLIFTILIAIFIWLTPSKTKARSFWHRSNVFNVLNVASNIVVTTAGNGLQVKEGTNSKMGTNALVNGTVTVSTTAITAASRILLTKQVGAGTTRGEPEIGTRVVGTSFVINSMYTNGVVSPDDDSVVFWFIVEPSP